MRTAPLRRLAEFVNGGTPTSDLHYWGGEVLWATPIDLADVDGGTLRETQRTLTRRGLRAGSACVPADALILSTRAPIGYVTRTSSCTAFNQGCRGVVPRPGNSTRYLQHVIWAAKPDLQAAGSGSTFRELSTDALAELPVPVATADEQRRIADFLDDQVARLDAVKAQAQALLPILRECQQRRLLEELILPNDEMSSLRRLGARVTTGPFGTVLRANEYVDDGVPIVNPTHILGGRIVPASGHAVSASKARRLRRHALRRGDLVTARKGDVGRSATVTPAEDGWICGSDAIALHMDQARQEPRFVAALLALDGTRAALVAASPGATMPTLNEGMLLSLLAPNVPIQEQRRRAQLCDELQETLVAAEGHQGRLSRLLEERKRALITACVTGEFDVATASSRAAGAALAGAR